METTNFSVTVGTITYYDFPTFSELNRYRPDVVAQMLIFFRMLGLCSLRQINRAIGNDDDDYRAQWMMTHAGLPDHVDESHAAENIAYTEEIQREILGDDTKHYFIKVTDVASKLHKIHNVSPQKALNEIINELKGIAETSERKEKKMEKKVIESETTKRSAPPTLATIRPEDEQEVQRLSNGCPIEPIRDVAKVRKDKEYLEQLVGYFPHVTASLIARYLFNEMVKISAVNNMFYLAKIAREKTGNWRHPSLDTIRERAAFVAWTGGDWREYLAENLPLDEVKPAAPEPATPEIVAPEAEAEAAPEPEVVAEPEWNDFGDDLDLPLPEPEPVEVPAPAEEPEQEWTRLEDCQEWNDYIGKKEPAAPAEEPKKEPEKPAFVAEIKISATNPEILRILNWLETETASEILDYTVYRAQAK